MDEDMFLSRLVAMGQVGTGNSPLPDTVWAAEGIQREVVLGTGEPISISSSLVKAGQPGSSSSSNSNMVKAGQPDRSGNNSSSSSRSNMAKVGQMGNNNSKVRTGAVSYTHLTLPTIYSV